MKRIFSIFLCLLLICGIFSGCDQQDGPYVPTGDALDDGSGDTQPAQSPAEQALTLCYYADRSLNPYKCGDFTNRVLFSLLYQGLFSVDRDYQVEPVLCQKYSVSTDMCTYIFYPDTGARFSDGTALTAEDVAASLNAAKAEGYYAGRFQHVQSISVVGQGVVVELDTAFENLPLLLDIPIVQASQVGDEEPLGTGPYAMEDSISGRRLRRISSWWCSAELAVTASYIPLAAAEGVNDIRDQFELGDVGLVCTDPCVASYADYHGDYEIWDSENGLFLYLVCHQSSEVFSNDTVRRALTHAIDRDSLAAEYYNGFARSATLPASPQSPWYNAALAARYGYSLSTFAEAVEEAGFQGKEITLVLNADDALRLRAGRAIAEMIQAGGLKVTVVELSGEKYTEKIIYGSYDLYLGQTKLSPNMDLSAFFSQGGSLSRGGLANSSLSAIAKEALANSGNFYNLHQMVMEDAHLCPILFRSYGVYAERGLISGLEPSRDNVFYYSTGKTLDDILSEE